MGQLDDDLGARVRLARMHAGLNQTKLGEVLGIERKTVAAIENNEARHELTIPEAQKIARATGVPLSFLVIGWAAPPELEERVSALEALRESAQRERDALIDRIDSLEDELRTQLARVVSEASTRARSQPRRRRPPGRKDQPAP